MSSHTEHKLRTILFLILVMCTAATFGYGLYKKEHAISGSKELAVKLRDRVAEVAKPSRTPDPEKHKATQTKVSAKKEVCGCTKHHVKFKRDHYDRHRETAQRLNNSVILTDASVHSSKNLQKVKNGAGYVIDDHKLTHSHAYLNSKAYTVLKEMGTAYAEKVKDTKAEGSVFHISSLSRTKEQQKKLLKSAAGRNATRKASAHSYGASFDIWKLDNTNSCNESRKAFETVLKDFQKKGKILLCPEGNCIHVTVRK